MELTTIDVNIGIELLDLISKDVLTLEAAQIIIEALNKGDIKATYKSEIEVAEYNDVYGNEIIRFIPTGEYEDKSNIEDIAYDFKCIRMNYGEEAAIKRLNYIVKPRKRQYKRRRY